MSNRELDAQVAVEVMGWTLAGKYWQQPDECELLVDDWSPTCDLSDVATVRAEIERRGQDCSDLFMYELGKILSGVKRGHDTSMEWLYLNATPEAQCRAARAAVKAAKP